MDNLEFVKRKKQYRDKARENVELIEKIVDSKDSTDSRAFYTRMLIEPSNELEIRYADATLNFFSDVDALMTGLSAGAVKDIPLDENISVEYMGKLLKEDDTKGKLSDKLGDVLFYTPYEEIGKVVYQWLVTFTHGLTSEQEENKELEKKLFEISGYNPNDNLDRLKIRLGIGTITSELFSLGDDLTEINPYHARVMEGIAKGFHEEFEKGKSEEYDFRVALSKLLFGPLSNIE